MVYRTFLLGIIFFISVILVIAFGYLNYKYKRRGINYYMMFIVGIAWTILGLIFKLTFLIIVGALFSVWAYIKKSEWDEDLTGLKNVHKKEINSVKEQTDSLETIFVWLIFIGAIALLGVIAYVSIQMIWGAA